MTTVDVAPKNFLTTSEMTKFLAAARQGKHGVRDYLLGLMAYRHGMRVSELIHIRLDDIDLDAGRIFVRRAKGSMSTIHPMQGDEVRAVRAWLRERKHFLPVESAVPAGSRENGDAKCPSNVGEGVVLAKEIHRPSPRQKAISQRGEVAVINSGGNKPPSSTALGTDLQDRIATRDQSHPDMALSVVEDANESKGLDTGRHKPLMRNDKTRDDVPAQGVTESATISDAARNGETPLDPNPSPCMVQPPASGHSLSGVEVDARSIPTGEARISGGNEIDGVTNERSSRDDTAKASATSAQNNSNGEATSRQIPSAHCGNVEADSSPFLFLNEKRRVFARQAINYLFGEIGKRAGIGHVWPHCFRHSAGYALANAGVPTRTIQLFLGHKDIHHTERYTTLSAKALDNIVWQV